ncbi:MAG: NADH-quinone oxidoreductase subunit NuoE [Bacteroidales bacterium]
MQDITDKILENYPRAKRGDLIPILQDVQAAAGYLTEEAVVKVGRHLKLPTSKIYGIATFYNQFSFEPRGRYHIQVCHGTTCHVAGGMNLIRELEKQLRIHHGETSRDGRFSIEIVSCMGACGKAPVVAVNDDYYIRMNADELKELLGFIRKKDE